MGEEGGVFTKDSTNFFSVIGGPWWEHQVYTNVVNELRESVKDTDYREIWIVTSGPISTESIDSVLLELEKANEITTSKLPNGLFQWHALNHTLKESKVVEIKNRFKLNRASFISVSEFYHHTNSSEEMYDARDSVRAYVESKSENPIVCWLDSDLIFSTLIPKDGALEIIQTWPWLHMVWHYWRKFPEVDVWVGDVTGDPPIPASSTIYSNLLDLTNTNNTMGSERWEIRDPAYDFSDLNEMNKPFPPIESDWCHLTDINEILLWGGTLFRPLVASKNILIKPHRPWFVRGGVTVLFSKRALNQKTPRFHYGRYALRRGDSFWVVKSKLVHGLVIKHWPFPLLHKRRSTGLNMPDLVQSFHDRYVGDLIAACCLKSLIISMESEIDFQVQFRDNLIKRGAQAIDLFKQCKDLLTDLDDETFDYDRLYLNSALEYLINTTQQIDYYDVAEHVSQQVIQFMEGLIDE